MNHPHKFKDVIIAWANGEEIEFRDPNFSTEWNPIKNPSWLADTEYRVKPKPTESTITFRVGVGVCDDGSFYTVTADNTAEEQLIQAEPSFIGWISDWELALLTKVEE